MRPEDSAIAFAWGYSPTSRTPPAPRYQDFPVPGAEGKVHTNLRDALRAEVLYTPQDLNYVMKQWRDGFTSNPEHQATVSISDVYEDPTMYVCGIDYADIEQCVIACQIPSGGYRTGTSQAISSGRQWGKSWIWEQAQQAAVQRGCRAWLAEDAKRPVLSNIVEILSK